MSELSLHCYRCGKGPLKFFCFEVIKARTSTEPPQEATVCVECHDAHPECEYAMGKED